MVFWRPCVTPRRLRESQGAKGRRMIAPSGAQPRLTGRSLLCSERGSSSKRRRRLSTVVPSREKGGRSKGRWSAKTSTVRARCTEEAAKTPTPEEADAVSVRRRHENSRLAMKCLCICIGFWGLTSSLRGGPAAKPTGNLQAQLAGRPLEALVRPRRLKSRTTSATTGTGAARTRRLNCCRRRSAGRRAKTSEPFTDVRDRTTVGQAQDVATR
jgi:hypothetical protein